MSAGSRSVLVSGGTGGIGLAIARAFQALGDRVAVLGRHSSKLRKAAEEGFATVRADLTVPDDVGQVATSVESIDVLVNSAGGNGSHLPEVADDLAGTAAHWRAVLDRNVLSAVLLTGALESRLVAGGSVVSIGSIGAEYGSGAYGPAKAALASWSAGLAARLGPRGITANIISPGFVDGTEFFRGGISDTRRAHLVEQTFDGRPGHPEDVAAVALFLASTGARHVTGQALHVNGGAFTTR